MDQIYLRDLTLRCIIGTRPAERITRQEVRVGVTLDCDLSKAGKTDRLADTVDFRRLEAAIIRLVEGSEFQLIERMAERIADACLADPGVRAARVSVDKPRALRFARSAAVEIVRRRVASRRG